MSFHAIKSQILIYLKVTFAIGACIGLPKKKTGPPSAHLPELSSRSSRSFERMRPFHISFIF